MGNAKRFKPVSNRILGVSMVLFSIGSSVSSANAAGCSAEIVKDAAGAYAGCNVKMGHREYSVSKENSSENGCNQVCGIMAEVSGARGGRQQKVSAVKLNP